MHSLQRAKGHSWRPWSARTHWSILESPAQRHVPTSVTSPEHWGPALPGHRDSPGNAAGRGKPPMPGSPVLLHPGALAGGQQQPASLSCHCNPIIYLLPSCGHRVPILGDLTATQQLGEGCPPTFSAGRKAALAPSRPAARPRQGPGGRMRLMPFAHAPAARHGRWGPQARGAHASSLGLKVCMSPAWHQRRRTSANTAASGAGGGYLGPGSGKTLGA